MDYREGDRLAGVLVSRRSTPALRNKAGFRSGLSNQSPVAWDTTGHLLTHCGPGLSPPLLHIPNQESLSRDAPPVQGSGPTRPAWSGPNAMQVSTAV